MIRAISHVALRVADVEEAEAYYAGLFALKVAFRDLQADGKQRSLRPGVTWAQAKAKGYSPQLTALGREGFFLALEQADEPGTGQLDHLGLDVDAGELDAVADRLVAHECRLLARRADLLLLVDRYGLRWELTTSTFENLAAQSTGARTGDWLDLG